MDKIIEELKKWVNKNYSFTKCGWTDERSEGNYSDCFSDGEECVLHGQLIMLGKF